VTIWLAATVLGGLLFWIVRTSRLRLPYGQALENNVELSVLLGLGLCFMAASQTGFMGLSLVFGAFCAGLAISHTNLRKPIFNATHPLKSLLIVIFFVSIGLLVDLNYVAAYWGVILAVTVAVLCFKTILGGVLFYVGGEPIGRALVFSLITPQIGDLSFVLTTTGVASGIFISQEADFLLAVIAASLFVSPIWSNVLHYLVVRSKIYRLGEPTKLSNAPG
jgi:CPA2 family monovalent cation:H+ antiporter-2